MKDKKIYIAGPLFKQGDIKERIYEENKLKDLGFTNIFNPITAPFNEDKTKSMPTSEDIFNGDTNQILKSDVILAELDSEDSGVCTELGIAWAANYFTDRIKEALKKENPLKEIKKITKEIPRKDVISHLTDIRVESSGKYDSIRVPVGFNQYTIGCVLESGLIYTDKDEMFEELEEVVSYEDFK